jgi:hypothetical protein
MNYELAEQVGRLAAPIYAALMQRASHVDLQSKSWQQDARAAALRQARLLWDETLDSVSPP